MSTITYQLAPEPVWILIGLDGLAAGGGYIKTWRSLNKVQQKPIFVDAGGKEAWTNPTYFDLNGVQGPFYWKSDSADLTDTYFVQAFDAQNNLLWEIDDFFPSGSGGGGGDVTTYLSLKNYIANNQFINHITDNAGPLPINLYIAPSNHKGFTPAINALIGTYGALGADIRFVKNNTTATDSVSFPLFTLGTPVLNPDVTPVDYVRYQCTNTPTGENYKAFQFPITQKVNNLSNQDMTFILWAAVTSTPVTINIYIRQYYGSGTAATTESASTRVLIGSCSLTSSWSKFSIPFTVANVSGNSIGTPGKQTDDDAVYVQIEMPLNAACDVLFTKPSLYLGTVNPDTEFDDYDQIDSINLTPRTGDVRVSLTPGPATGWLAMNDTTIGNTASGATTSGAFTFQLYSTLYTSVSNTYAPVSGGRTAPGTTMSNAITDFLLGKTLTMPLSLGRALAGYGSGSGLTSRVLGETTGVQTITLTGNNMPSNVPVAGGVFSTQGVRADIADTFVPGGAITWTSGTNTSFSIISPTTFMGIFIKL